MATATLQYSIPQVLKVIQPSSHPFYDRSTVEDSTIPLPTSATLSFPPFPSKPQSSSLTSYNDWNTRGVWLAPCSSNGRQWKHSRGSVRPQDHHLTPLIPCGEPSCQLDNVSGQLRARRPMGPIAASDCWKIGEEGVEWHEPEVSSGSTYPTTAFISLLPPFQRVIQAATDFLVSRREEFQYTRTKKLFDLFRDAVGLRTEYSGAHWPGSGSAGQPYQERSAQRLREPRGVITTPSVGEERPEEVCVFLTDTETSVRGFLALARREAEAGWNFDPAHKLATIVSAFMAYLVHHDVLPETKYKEPLLKATAVARAAPRQLRDAKAFEDVVCSGKCLNRMCWCLWGGKYCGPERGGMERESRGSDSKVQPAGVDDANGLDDGGWTVENVEDVRPEAPDSASCQRLIHPLLMPLDVDEVKMLQYLPYSRRRVVEIRVPSGSHTVSFQSQLYELITEPAPWTREERWRSRGPQVYSEDLDDDGPSEATDPGPLEKEEATITEPARLSIWAESEAFGSGIPADLIGIGLRGRWALMGTAETAWWTFKAKDYVLPAFWQSTRVME